MIVLDTNALVFDALAPERLTTAARQAMDEGEANLALACSDISLWEIAMLVAKDRLRVATDTRSFLDQLLISRSIKVLPITPEIAALSQCSALTGGDPADRLISATALEHRAPLVTSDRRLRNIGDLATVW